MVIDLSANCVARWKMNEDAPSTDVGDTSGNGHNGVSERNTNLLHTSSGNPPWLNGAFDFNGSGDYIRVADDDVWDFTSRDFSVFFWFKKTSNVPGYIINHRGIGGVSGWDVWYANYKLRGLIKKGALQVAVVSALVVNDDTWHSAYIGWDRNALIAMEIDNSSPSTSAPIYSIDDISNDEDLSIGVKLSGEQTSYFFDGIMDCVMIFDRVLTADERSFLYNNGHGTENLSTAGRQLVGGLLAAGKRGLV